VSSSISPPYHDDTKAMADSSQQGRALGSAVGLAEEVQKKNPEAGDGARLAESAEGCGVEAHRPGPTENNSQ